MFPALFGFLSGEVAGSATDHRSIRKKFWKNAVFFVLGFSITMVVLGIIASFIGEAVSSVVGTVKVISGIILLFLGLHQMRLFHLKFLPKFTKLETVAANQVGAVKPGYLRSFVAGLVIAPGWGQIFLGSVLLVVAVNGNLVLNILQMIAYSLGFSLMFFITFIFGEPLRRLYQKLGDKAKRIEQFGGAMLVFVALLMISGKLNWITDLANWKGGLLVRNFIDLF